jgi:molybdenum cofactor guanylyltransferase
LAQRAALPTNDEAAMIDSRDITGLVLAGGRGSRMDGADKGLQTYLGTPLVSHAVGRLARQVGHLMISANRNLDAYRALGVPVWPDATADYGGPLAGFLSGLAHCTTPYLATVPCDTPFLPADLIARLAAGLEGDDDAAIAMAATREDGALRPQPVFCLMRTTVRDSLLAFTAGGGRKIDAWTAALKRVVVEFGDGRAFVNVNTQAELEQLQRLD